MSVARESGTDIRAARIEGLFEWPILAAALLVKFGSALNWTVWLAFACELVALLVVKPRETQRPSLGARMRSSSDDAGRLI